MAVWSKTRDNLVELCCRTFLRDWVEGTATSDGSSTTVKDTSLAAYQDDYFNDQNSWIYIRSGTYAGHWAKISDFAVSAGVGTITFAPAAVGSIVTGVTYSIHTEFSRDDIVEAINAAIAKAARKGLLWKVDTTSTTLAAGTYEYDVPTGFIYIVRLVMADSGGTFDDMPEIPPDQYDIMKGATPKIRFKLTHADTKFDAHYYGQLWAETELVASRVVRVEGLGGQAELATDAATCGINPIYVAAQAATFLWLPRIKRPENEPDEARTHYLMCKQTANEEWKSTVVKQLPVNAKRVEP